MPEPYSLMDCEAATERLARAIERGERVAIFGDYDVDGASSSALLYRFLTHFGVPAEIYIPDRIFEGYGPNPNAIGQLIDRGAQLIVTVDCGSTSHESLAVARERGIDVVVIDHHQVGETLPPALALVNPNREDDLSGQGHLPPLASSSWCWWPCSGSCARRAIRGRGASISSPCSIWWRFPRSATSFR